MIWKTLFIPCQRADCLKMRVSMRVAEVGYIRVPCGVKQVPCSIERKAVCLQGVCVYVRNSCKCSSNWFPCFDRHLIPSGGGQGRARGRLCMMRRSAVGGVQAALVYVWS